MDVFCDARDITYRFGEYVNDLRRLLVFHGLGYGTAEDLAALSTQLEQSRLLRTDLSALVRDIHDRERSGISADEMLTILALGSGGERLVSERIPRFGISATVSMLGMLIAGVGAWADDHGDGPSPAAESTPRDSWEQVDRARSAATEPVQPPPAGPLGHVPQPPPEENLGSVIEELKVRLATMAQDMSRLQHVVDGSFRDPAGVPQAIAPQSSGTPLREQSGSSLVASPLSARSASSQPNQELNWEPLRGSQGPVAVSITGRDGEAAATAEPPLAVNSFADPIAASGLQASPEETVVPEDARRPEPLASPETVGADRLWAGIADAFATLQHNGDRPAEPTERPSESRHVASPDPFRRVEESPTAPVPPSQPNGLAAAAVTRSKAQVNQEQPRQEQPRQEQAKQAQARPEQAKQAQARPEPGLAAGSGSRAPQAGRLQARAEEMLARIWSAGGPDGRRRALVGAAALLVLVVAAASFARSRRPLTTDSQPAVFASGATGHAGDGSTTTNGPAIAPSADAAISSGNVTQPLQTDDRAATNLTSGPQNFGPSGTQPSAEAASPARLPDESGDRSPGVRSATNTQRNNLLNTEHASGQEESASAVTAPLDPAAGARAMAGSTTDVPLNGSSERRGPLVVPPGTMEKKLILERKPVYPPEALLQHMEGTVVLNAFIAKDGTVRRMDVVEGHPPFLKSAMAAVSWRRYHPYLSNGRPVEVVTQITIKYPPQR